LKLTEEFILENSHWRSEITQQILQNQKLRELNERQKINTKAVLSDDSLNKEELQRLLNLFDYLLEESKK